MPDLRRRRPWPSTYRRIRQGHDVPVRLRLDLARHVELDLDAVNVTATVFVSCRSAGETITVRNNAAPATVIVDELGYFGTGSEAGGYAGQQPSR